MHDAQGRERQIVHFRANRAQGIIDGAENCRRGADGATFADTLDAKFGMRRWRLHVQHADGRYFGRATVSVGRDDAGSTYQAKRDLRL